jgi:hypothetical protein
MPIEETYCQLFLEGRLSNIVPDTRADEQVRDLAVTRAADIGAYIGVPVTTLDARLYILCCLAHKQQPSLSRPDGCSCADSEKRSPPNSTPRP